MASNTAKTTRQPAADVDDITAVELWGRVISGFQVTNRRVHLAIKGAFNLNEAEAETLLAAVQTQCWEATQTRLTRLEGLYERARFFRRGK